MTRVPGRERFTRRAARLLAVSTLALPPATGVAGSTATGTAAITLKAEAGLGGVCRPGRWVPVRVWLTNDGPDVTGELIVQWGSATLHRAVALASPSRVRLEFYLRTLEARAALTIRLRSHGVDLRSVELPMRALGTDESLTLCVTAAGSPAAAGVSCTSTLAPDDLPRSMRGYDAADGVVWQGGSRASLAADQRSAFARWEAYHHLERAGLLSRLPTPSHGSVRLTGPRWSRRAVAAGIGVYLVALLVAGWHGRRPRRRPLGVYAILTLLVCLWSSIGLAVGRIGPGRDVVVRQTSTLCQLGGDGSYVSMRGVVEYPAFDAFAVRASVADLSFAPTSIGPSEEWLDGDGYSRLPGVFGLGARQAFALEGVVEFAPLEVVREAAGVRVTNRSRTELRDCRFPEGFSPQDVGALRPGQTVEARELGAIDAPFFGCTVAPGPVTFTDARHPVRTEGASVVAVYLDAGDDASPRPGRLQ